MIAPAMPAEDPLDWTPDQARQFVAETAAGALAWLPADEVQRLCERFGSPAALRARRLDQRDAAIRALSEWMPAGSGREMAKRIAAELLRYAASGWRFERGRPAPDDPRRAALHQAMSLSGGPIGAVQVARIMAGARSRTAS